MNIQIQEVNNKRLKAAFINFPHDLYQNDNNYVPELDLSIKDLLNEKKNPFFAHSVAKIFLAFHDTKVVGRIAGIINNRYNEYHKSNIGFFGFFDCINDQSVADKLFETAEEYLKEFKVDQIHGPTNFTTNDTAGVLVDGFLSPAVFGMTFNKEYYASLIENYGFTKEMDLYAYWIGTETVNKKAFQISKLLEDRLQKEGIVIRNMTKKSQKSDLAKIKDIYKGAWEDNWGFVPPTDAEYDHLAEGLNLLIDHDFLYIAEKNGEMIGFGAGIPDINEIAIGFNKGRLLPFNIFKLLMKKKKTRKIRIILLGVLEEYRKKGIAAIFFARFIETAKKRGIDGGEASWILESNEMMNKAAVNLNGEKYKTYRIYSKPLIA
jgi:GNAT superfamily N-acetyltransferase